MRLGIAIALLGLFFVPLSTLFRPPSNLAVPYVIGLTLVAAGVFRLAAQIAAWIRTPHAKRVGESQLNMSLVAFSLLSFYLLAECGASAVLVLGNLRHTIGDFRDRQTLASAERKLSHPFLLMVHNPALEGVNALGFKDRDWPVEKPAGTIRIACLGASTSDDQYPQRLNRELKLQFPELQIEVLNFGNGGWTTAQTLINYVLNVRHFSPDWIILHHATNDRRSWRRGRHRTDYSDSYRILSPEQRPDAFLIRYFNSYALAKYAYFKARAINPGLSVYAVIFRNAEQQGPPTDVDLALFKGNVEEIIRVAQAHGTKVLLTTQPYSLTDLRWGRHWVEDMSLANDILRSVASDLGLPLVDLDKLITGKEESFRDPIHLKSNGVEIKVQAIAEILVPLLSEDSR